MFCIYSYGTEYSINSVDAFNSLNLNAGDIVVWENGTYSSDERIAFIGTGTLASPIILKAETPGGVVFDNGLQIDIAGTHLIVDGFYWQGGYGSSNFIQFRKGTIYAQNCTIKNCAINGLQVNPDDAESGTSVKHRWIVLYGNYNNVLNCSFLNKTSAGALVLVELEYNAAVNRCAEVGHTISNNYFYNYEKINSSLTNAGDSETIRVGTSEFQNVNCRTIVSNNYFVSADGENEIITNKSDNNTYSNNTFRRCRGSLVLRHGSGATVDGNYFLGENIDGTGGLRIVDSDHTITNNYIQDCITIIDQAKWNNGITFMGGADNSQPDCNSTSVSNGYQKSENNEVSNNTIINTNAPLFFNGDKGTNSNTGNISNNLIFFENGSSNLTDIITEDGSGDFSSIGSSLTFSGNIYNGANLGESVNGFSSSNLAASTNGEILTISGAGNAGASIANGPLTDGDVGASVGACFVNATGGSTSGCSGVTNDFLNVSSLNSFNENGGSQTLTISSNVNWSVSENSSWIAVNTTSGSDNGIITITTSENTSATQRTGTVTVTGGGLSKTITITQNGQSIVTPGECTEGTNLSLSATIDNFSTQENTTNAANNILDESTANRWSAKFFPQYAVIDLGSEYAVNEINLVPYEDRAYQFLVEGSTSDATSGFSVLTDATGNTSGGSNINRTFESQTVRYVKLTITGASGYDGDWSSIHSFQVNCAGEEVVPDALEVAAVSEFTADGQSKTATISSNVDWTVTDNQSWISVSPTSGSDNGTISITTTENTSTSARNGIVTVTGGDLTKTISISQAGQTIIDPESCEAGANLSLVAAIDNYSTQQNTTNTVTNILDESTGNRWSAAGFPQYAVIDLGGEYAVNEINLVPYSDRAYQFLVEGSTSGATSGFSILTDATGNTSGGSNINKTFESKTVRYVKLTITGASGYDGDWSSIHSFQINCAGGEVEPEELEVATVSAFVANGQSKTASISSNVDWSVTDNQSWISVSPTSGSNDGTISITTTENTSTSTRNGTVTITGGDLTKTISISQAGQTIVASESCVAGTNLSLAASIDNYSSQQNTTHNVSNILDESSENRWSAEGFPQYAVIDLGGVYDIGEINLVPFSDRAYQFLVEGSISDAASGFSTLVDATDNTSGGSNINKSFDEQAVRYVKLTITGASGYDGDWSSIHSFQIVCAGDVIEPAELEVTSVSEFTATGESKTASISSNVSWTITDNQSWIALSTASGSNDGTINITTTENTSTSERNGTITVAGGDLTKTISVTQAGKEEIIVETTECSGGTNLAENATIVAFSADQSDTNPVANLIDGNDENRWSAEFFPQFAIIDLGAVYEVDEINLVPYSNRSYQFLVEGSASSATSDFSVLTDATGNTETENINRSFTSKNVRYVKLTITGASNYTGDWSSINEFQVICAGEEEEPTGNLSVSSISNFSANGGNQNVNVSSNSNWSVSESSSWVSITNSNGSNDGSFTITTVENTNTSSRSTIVTIEGEGLSETIIVTQSGATVIGELDPNSPPSDNFDLSQWYLSVPIDNGNGIATSITVDNLNEGYELKDVGSRDYFYTATDGGMVFRNYPKDAPKTSKETSYSRNELREMLSSGENNSAKDPQNNWWFSSSDDIPYDNSDDDDAEDNTAGGVDGVLTATLKVNRVTETAESSSQVGRIIVGQIHASDNEPNRLYYHKQPDHDKGAIYVCHEDFDGNEVYYNIIGDYAEETGSKAGDYTGADEPSDGIALNEEFSYKIEVIGNDQWVTISRPGKADITKYIDMHDSKYDTENDYMYFKAGVYSQNKSCQEDDDYDQVTFYKLNQTHNTLLRSKSSNEDVFEKIYKKTISIYPNPFASEINIVLNSPDVTTVRLIDMFGKVIRTKTGKNTVNITNLSSLAQGIYVLLIIDANNQIIKKEKLIKH